jgi:hypothetical protein
VYYTPYFTTWFSSTWRLLRLREPGVSVTYLCHFEFCTRSHVFNNFVIPSKRFPTDGMLEGSREEDIWRSNFWAVCWARKNIPCFAIASCVFRACVWSHTVQLKEHNSNIYARSDPPETLLQDLKCLNDRP